jgi:hypothetical protein
VALTAGPDVCTERCPRREARADEVSDRDRVFVSPLAGSGWFWPWVEAPGQRAAAFASSPRLSGAPGRVGSPSPVADFRLRQWPTSGAADGEIAK